MNIKQIKAYLESKRGLLSCVDYESLAKAVDFSSIQEQATKMDATFGMPHWGSPALRLEKETAVINIRGLLVPDVGFDLVQFGLTGYDVIEHYVSYANNLPQITQIVLDIDSGGGYAKGVQQCAERIANSQKPIITFVSGDMYSAAYWLGCSTQRIEAKSFAGIGSIGVYATHFDNSAHLAQQGIIARMFKSGKWKGAFGSDLPLTEEEQARLQQDVEQTADEFFTHVFKMRGISKEKVASFDGDTFSAEQALERGLIDHIYNVNQTENGGGEMGNNGMAEGHQLINQAEIERIKAEALAEAKAEFEAKIEREKAILALDVSEDVKKVLSSEAFAGVSIEAMGELIKAMPKGFSQAMDEHGGAGVEADPTHFAGNQEELAEKQKAIEELAKIHQAGGTNGML